MVKVNNTTKCNIMIINNITVIKIRISEYSLIKIKDIKIIIN